MRALCSILACALLCSCSATIESGAASDVADASDTTRTDAGEAEDAVDDTAVDTDEDAPAPDAAEDPGTSDASDASPTDADAAPMDADPPDAPPEPCVDGACPDGFQCYTEGCIRFIPAGDPCDRTSVLPPCEFGSRCVTVEDEDRCVPDGTDQGICRHPGNDGGACRTQPVCDDGLGCDPTRWVGGHCRPALPAGAFCPSPNDVCNAGTACVEVDGVRRCVADGARAGGCRPPFDAASPPPLCDEGLTCAQAFEGCIRGYDRCVRSVGPGARCDGADRCAEGLECVRGDDGVGVCVDPGALGATCETDDACTDPGAACVRVGFEGVGRCRVALGEGDVCDASGRTTACPEAMTCTADHPADVGRCAADGTVPGAECEAGDAPCDEGLTCSFFSRYRQTCRAVVDEGERCDLGAIAHVCDDGLRCVPVATDDAGTVDARCFAPRPEREPNDDDDDLLAAAPGEPLLVQASESLGATDCVAAEVEASGGLYLEIAAATGGFDAGMRIRLFAPDGSERGQWLHSMLPRNPAGPLAGSARLSAWTNPALADLPAGRHVVCIDGVTDPGTDYVLAVGVIAAD